MPEITTSFNLASLPNGNHYNFGCDIKAYIEMYPVVSQRFGYLTAPYIAALQVEDEAIKQITWSDLTEPIRQQDEIRDKSLETFKDILRGYMRIAPTEQMMADAQKVARYVKNNNVNPNAQYDRETGMMTNLIQDLQLYCAQELERLHLDAIVAQMKAANDEVFRLLLERDVEYGERKKEAVTRARREVDKLYLALRNSVNAYAMVDGEGIFTPFINSVNATIKRLNEQVFKIGSSSGSEGEETEGEGTGSEGEEQQPTTYTLTFEHNGETVSTQQLEAGAAITPPAAPTGYHWVDVPSVMPAENLTILSAEDEEEEPPILS